MEMWMIAIAVLGIAGFYLVSVYNGLQSLLTEIEAANQEIGNQLKRQASLIPNLETSVKAFMKQEKDVFSMLTDARKNVAAAQGGSAAAVEKAEKSLQEVIPRLQVLVEDNPELKSNETVQQFMAELRDTADKLTYARRAVITLTQQYNQKLVVFPSNLVAKMFGFTKQTGLAMPADSSHMTLSDAESHDHKVNL